MEWRRPRRSRFWLLLLLLLVAQQVFRLQSSPPAAVEAAEAVPRHCRLSGPDAAAARRKLCRGLAMRNTTRIFLYGDSLIGQVGLALGVAHEGGGALAVAALRQAVEALLPNLEGVECQRWQHFAKTTFPIIGCEDRSVELVWMGQFTDPTCVASELYGKGELFRPPVETDLLLILQGAHHRMEKEDHVRVYTDFLRRVGSEVAGKFPGKVLWIEPFVQHFQRGIWVDDLGAVGGASSPEALQKAVRFNTGGPELQGCWSSDGIDDSMQLLRASLAREAAAAVPGVSVVPVYDTLKPLADCHQKQNDCTHYVFETYNVVWKTIGEVLGLSSFPASPLALKR